jgi:tetratricopeptide (TPR) repeat protein
VISLSNHRDLCSQGFQMKKISDKVFIVSNPDLGNQVVVQSEKGLVIFDSFWSEKTAKMFREEISKTLCRNDFFYVINTVDRLDMIGGNASYQEAIIVGHENIITKYSREELVKKEIAELIEMWREKEGYSRNRLQNLETGSEKALKEENWMNKCITMSDELKNSFSLILPKISFNDKITLYLGNIRINLFWFGNAGNYQGLIMAVIPEEKLAIISKAIVYPEYHLAPYPFPYFGVLDVPRWIEMLEKILEGENPVNNIILSDSYEIFSRELMHSHLNYIRKLWNSVKALESEGKTLQEIQDQLSIEKDFAFVKEMQVYKNMGDSWIRPQHEMHVRLFFLQGKILVSEIIKDGGPESLQASLNKIKKAGSDIYFDETSIDRIGYEWLNIGNVSEAIEVFKLNAETFPRSFSVFNRLGEAYIKNGDKINAKKNFEKSLELNPQNDNTRKILEQLK